MQYIFAESLKDLENKYKTQQKVEIFAELDSEVEDVIFKNKHLFEDEEIDFWISLDPYNDTLIEIEDIKTRSEYKKQVLKYSDKPLQAVFEIHEGNPYFGTDLPVE